MHVRLLRGEFFAVDGYAINDFEDLAIGDVSDITTGVDTNGDLSWDETVFFSRST